MAYPTNIPRTRDLELCTAKLSKIRGVWSSNTFLWLSRSGRTLSATIDQKIVPIYVLVVQPLLHHVSLQPSVTICLFRTGPFIAEYDFRPVDLYIMMCTRIHEKKVGCGVQAPELCCQEQQQPLLIVYFSEPTSLRRCTSCWFCDVQVTRGAKLKSVRYCHNNNSYSKYNVPGSI